MGRKRLRTPRYADVAATLALVVALGTGGAYAASSIISTAQIANGAVTTPKLANGAVKASKIASNAVTATKLDAATRTNILPPWGTIPHGKLVTGAFGDAETIESLNHHAVQILTLPAAAPVALTGANLAFGTTSVYPAGSSQCAGTLDAPNPAPGMFCVYFYSFVGLQNPVLDIWNVLNHKRSVLLHISMNASVGTEYAFWGIWAYKAP